MCSVPMHLNTHFACKRFRATRRIAAGRSKLDVMRPFAFAALLLASFTAISAQDRGWLGTWTTADMPMDAQAAAKLHLGESAITLRQIVHISQGGKQVRVRFSNEFGTAPLQISAAHLAFLSAGSKILPETDKVLLFAGQPSVTIPAGGFVATDPIVERVPIFSDLVITIALPAQSIPAVTFHAAAHTTTFVADGDKTAALELVSPRALPPGLSQPDVTAPVMAPVGEKPIVRSDRPTTDEGASAPAVPPKPVVQTSSWYFLKDVEVNAEKKSSAVVCFGDSITDGTGSTPETNRRWPDVLAPLLTADKHTEHIAVLNTGIGGNRLLHDGYGPKASDRFERDVLSQPGVRYVILLEGINDIGNGGVTAQDLIEGMTALASRAHARGLRIFGGTLTPYNGAGYYTPQGEAIRQQVNAFLRSNTVFDGHIDFDKAVQDPQDPTRFLPKFDHGDHLHPSDLGYAAMAPAVSLKLFRRK